MKTKPSPVTILLPTYNGAAFLPEQIASLKAQSCTDWHLIVSDDGSRDETVDLCARELSGASWRLRSGPCRGVAANVLSSILLVPYGHALAFCDQDDVWRPAKLERALTALAACTGPAIYTSDRFVTRRDLSALRLDRRGTAPFERLLWRGRAAGHTMVMNPQAASLLRRCVPETAPAFHDWWASLVLVGAGAHWIHDPEPTLLYRQHENNVLGASGGRLSRVMSGQYARWIRQNARVLDAARPVLLPGAARSLTRMQRLVGIGHLRGGRNADMTGAQRATRPRHHVQGFGEIWQQR